MTAATTERDHLYVGPIPYKGTLQLAANTKIIKGCLVQLDAAGRALNGADAQAGRAVGWATATYNNTGGSAGDISGEVEYGVGAAFIDGTAPIPGANVYVLDNQTITLDDNAGARGFAGIVTEIRTIYGVSMAMIHVAPSVAKSA